MPFDERKRLLVTASVGLMAWLGIWFAADALGVFVTEPVWRDRIPVVAGTVAVVITLGLMGLARFAPGWAALATVATTSVFLSGFATVALHGTRWGFHGIYSDSGFRAQAITRYADNAGLVDYGYQGLPGYYPPAWPWLQGRAAALLDVPAWTVMKPATLLAAALVPVLAYLLWRRVVPDLTAALVVLGTAVVTVSFQKPDEWLVLACVLPWWLEVVRGVRREDRYPLPRWAYGLILGGLLLTHTYYFLPLAVATVLGWGLDLLPGRRPPLRIKDAVVIGVVGLAVAAPYWLGMAVVRLTTAAPADNLQLRWSPRGFDMPPVPVPEDALGAVAVVAVVWLLLGLRRSPLALGMVLALVAGYVVMLGGQWLQRFDIAVLPHKSKDLIEAVLITGAVAAGVDLARGLRADARSVPTTVARVALAVAVAVLGVEAAVRFTDQWVTGKAAVVAQQIRYPDGSFPAGNGPVPSVEYEYAWGTRTGDPSTEEVRRAWLDISGTTPDDFADAVLVTTRADLLATTPVHSFIAWKSIYSHPLGEYDARLELLRDVGQCPDAACAGDLLRDNRFDPVDGLVAAREGDELVFPMAVDRFPEAWEFYELRLPLRLFDEPPFRRTNVGNVTVIAVS